MLHLNAFALSVFTPFLHLLMSVFYFILYYSIYDSMRKFLHAVKMQKSCHILPQSTEKTIKVIGGVVFEGKISFILDTIGIYINRQSLVKLKLVNLTHISFSQ